MYGRFKDHLDAELRQTRERGLYKKERILETPQGVEIRTESGMKVLNFCANNYLGFCNEPRVMAAANYAFFRWGFGLASVRFICGTQRVHKELEARLAEFLGTDDAILYSSAFDANGGVFEPLLDERCAIISDELNHASIIDGVRLAKAKRFVYRNNDMDDLEDQIIQAREARFKLIVTDGVFSMDGTIAQVDKICDLADRYEALVLVDDSHATGFIGPTGRGTHATWPTATRLSSSSTTPTPRASSVRPAAAPMSTAAAWTGSTSSSRPSARPSAGRPAAASPAAARSSSSSVSARGPTFSPTPCRRPSPGPRSRSSRSWASRPNCASG